MTHSNRKKREIRKFQAFRRNHQIQYCFLCGKPLRQECHHMLCNQCHTDKQRGLILG